MSVISDNWRARSEIRWDEWLTPRRTASWAGAIAAAAVLTGELQPLPWQLHLLAPLVAGGVGWMLALRWEDRPAMVVWGVLGLFVGASAAQRLGADALLVPLAVVGTFTGLVLGGSTTVVGDDQAAPPTIGPTSAQAEQVLRHDLAGPG